MVYPSNTLYRALAYSCFALALLLIVISAFLDQGWRTAFLLISPFIIIIAFSYFHLSNQG